MNEETFRVLSCNILCPPYNRIPVDSVESCFPDLWRSRIKRICELIAHENADVVCVQEYWFDDAFEKVVSHSLESDVFDIHTFRRQWKRYFKRDGLALCVARDSRKSYEISNLSFEDHGVRGTMIANVCLSNLRIAVANVHLTFPHHYHDEVRLRLSQMEKLVNELESRHTDCDVWIISGDLNCPGTPIVGNIDVVLQYLVEEKGFKSCYPGGGVGNSVVSHLNHLGGSVCADYVLFRPVSPNVHVRFQDFSVLPREFPTDVWPAGKFTLSDHRPLVATLKISK